MNMYGIHENKENVSMKKFNYVIKDSLGIHARPAGLLVKAAQQFESIINIDCKAKRADAKKIMALLSMGIKCNDEVVITIEGNDEEKAFTELQKFFKEQL